ncbi:hypothetical protein ACM66L_01325 [Escherichia coli]
MKDNLAKLIENTLKDILLANAALTFIFAIPMAIISRHGMGITIWFITVLIAPALCAVGAWLVSRTSGHAEGSFIVGGLSEFMFFILLRLPSFCLCTQSRK